MPAGTGAGLRKRHRSAAKSRREANARKNEWSKYVTTQFLHVSLIFPFNKIWSEEVTVGEGSVQSGCENENGWTLPTQEPETR